MIITVSLIRESRPADPGPDQRTDHHRSAGAGERLPSVRQLASDLDVAPGTVAKVYRSLEADGLLVSRAGSGTRVSDQAAPVSSAVAQAARRLAGAARREDLSLEEAVLVLRMTW